MDFLEEDMYAPICDYLRSNGYDVRGEVKDCDIAAYKDQKLTVVELKKAFNLKLIYQAIDRQDFAQSVYIAIGRSNKSMRDANFKSMVKLLKRLDIGLITVAMDSPIKTVEIILEPENQRKTKSYKRKKAIETEFEGRSGDFNTGGVNKKKIITAYREKSIEILCLVAKSEVISNSELREKGYDNKALSILQKNYYGWFEKVGRGKYGVSATGIEALEDEKYKKLIEHYSGD
ncbi:MAG: DUF2161 family putative PD-(D/E)XK-type phosphodiesterase [Lachnospiraceae bacterium]|nr:DUF2161 family putative PD-(D/E)XK-type phosphodiesterase [Lachnospiraceae bacterium]